MPQTVSNLWHLAMRGQPIDAARLSRAVEEEAAGSEQDYRTELLIRDSLDALERHWPPARFAAWYDGSDA